MAKERDMEAKASKHASKCEHACAGGEKVVPLDVPSADFFQYQAGAGRLAGRA